MKKIKNGFTLAEALIALLIASLIIAAMLPVITKRHRKIENHGRWECTYIPNGSYGGLMRFVQREYKNGVPGKWETPSIANVVGCTFTPPPGAEDFRITAVGGGGGGAGGLGGKFIEVINESTNGAYVATAEKGGTYYFKLQGAGGSGGGMGCGSPEGFNYAATVNSYFSSGNLYEGSDSTAGGVGSHPGSYYLKDYSFDYSTLYSNDSSKISNYLKYPSSNYCFSESGWTEWDFSNPENCWNLPGQGAYAGRTIEKSVDVKAGQSIYVYVGKGGQPTTAQLGDNTIVGSAGTAGENSFAFTGDVAAGSAPGYYRYRVSYPAYKSVPVRDCKLTVKELTGSYDTSEYHSCNSEANDLVSSGSGDGFWCTTAVCKSACPALNSSCRLTGNIYYDDEGNVTSDYQYCTGSYYVTVTHYYTYLDAVPDESTCVYKKVDISDLGLTACVTSSGSGPHSGYEADVPESINMKTESDSEFSETVAGAGSGGYGAGPNIYLTDDEKSYIAEPGQDGSALVSFTDFAGGGGGEAGKVVTAVFKKIGRVIAIPGAGGKGSMAGSEANGFAGGDTMVSYSYYVSGTVEQSGNYMVAEGGRGGKSASQVTGLQTEGNWGFFPGGNGGYPPLYANLNNHGEYAYGGRSSGNTKWSGQSAGTPATIRHDLSGTALLLLQLQLIQLQAGQIQPWELDVFGGGENDLTYGAGGGGGAGGGEQVDGGVNEFHGKSGSGGDGAPGIVIIEW